MSESYCDLLRDFKSHRSSKVAGLQKSQKRESHRRDLRGLCALAANSEVIPRSAVRSVVWGSALVYPRRSSCCAGVALSWLLVRAGNDLFPRHAPKQPKTRTNSAPTWWKRIPKDFLDNFKTFGRLPKTSGMDGGGVNDPWEKLSGAPVSAGHFKRQRIINTKKEFIWFSESFHWKPLPLQTGMEYEEVGKVTLHIGTKTYIILFFE